MQQEQIPKKKGSAFKKVAIITLGAGALATAGYFGYQYYRKSKEQSDDEPLAPDYVEKSSGSNSTAPAPKLLPVSSDEFPLKKGSAGARVTALQNALLAKAKKAGKVVMKNYGADGKFGSELLSALAALDYAVSVVDESLFNIITKGNSVSNLTPKYSPQQLAFSLNVSAGKKDFNSCYALLKQIPDSSTYDAVSEKFKYTFFKGKRFTLLSAMFEVFTALSQREVLQKTFGDMGLIYDGAKWSSPTAAQPTNGLNETSRRIITKQPTMVWKENEEPIEVDTGLILD